eukprot:jgi/Ulvmu1/6654/UM003_0292.1
MSRVTLLRCDARSKGVVCRVGGRGCMLRAGHCTLTGADSACAVSVEAAAMLADTELRSIRSAATEGVITVTDARASLLRCAVRDSVTGVRIVGGHLAARDSLIAGTFPRVKDVTDDTAPPNPGAACSCLRGILTVTGGAVKGCGVGVWLGALHWETGRPSGACRAHVGGVVFEGYGSAFQVMSGSTVEIDGCESWGRDCQDAGERAVQPRGPNGEQRDFTSQTALRFTSGQGAVRGSRFEGNTCDVDGDVRGALRVTCCEFKNRYVPERGGLIPPTDAMSSPCVSVAGDILLEDCTFSNVKCGVACCGDDCTIRRCTFMHVCGGVMVMDGDRLKMLDCKFENGTQACLIGHGSTVAAQDCVCDGFKSGFIVARGGRGVVTAKRVTVRGGKRAVMVLSDPGPVTEVKLVECVMQGRDEGVWLAGAGVRASLLNCELSGSDVGLQVNASVTARMRKSRVTTCKTGIRIGEDVRNMMSPCQACGVDSRSQRAVEAAFKALCRSAQRSTSGHCPRQGGVGHGQLTLGDVVVRNCSRGLYISTHGRVDAVDMHVEACSHSVLQRSTGSRSRARSVRVYGGGL